MPNVAPRGVYGYRTDRTPAKAADVWGCLTSGEPYLPAKTVWEFDGTNWRLLWARAATAPASAAAAFAAPAKVNVTWVETFPVVANQYRVLRPDGTLVGTAPPGATALVDTDPRPGVGPYRVQGQLDTETSGASVDTALIAIAPAPTNVVATMTGRACALTWTAAPATDTYAHYRTADGAYVGDDPTSPSAPAVVPGSQTQIRLYSKLATGRLGAYTDSNLVSVPPMPPVFAYFNSGFNAVTLGWLAPVSGIVSVYRVQFSTDGSTWNTEYLTTAGVQSAPTTVPMYARVRSEAPGGASEWVQAGPVTPGTDTAGPGGSTIASWVPEASYARMVVKGFWPGDSDVARGQIFVNNQVGSGWVLIYDGGASPNGYLQIAWQFGQGDIPAVLVRTFDVHGNQGADVTATYAQIIPEAFYCDPTEGLTARNGGYRTDPAGNGARIFTGYDDGDNFGTFLYGPLIHDVLSVPGRTMVSATIETWRKDTVGNPGAIPIGVWIHQLGNSAEGSPMPVQPPGYNFESSGMTRSGSDSTQVDVTIMAAMIRDQEYRGFLFYHPALDPDPNAAASFFMQCGDPNEGGGAPYRVSGRVILHTLG